MDFAAYKPVVSALVMPPVPGLILILLGARLIQPKRGWGYTVLFLGILSIWFSGANVTALWLQNGVLKPSVPIAGEAMQRLKDLGKGSGGYGSNRLAARLGIKPVVPTTAIVVLGGMGSQIGVVLAAIVMTVLPELAREFNEYRMLMFGLLMVFMMIWRPQGLLPMSRPHMELRK